MIKHRVVASGGGEVGPGPHFMFGPWLLHTSNIVFKICVPPLRNPGDGPNGVFKHEPE